MASTKNSKDQMKKRVTQSRAAIKRSLERAGWESMQAVYSGKPDLVGAPVPKIKFN